MGEGIGNAFVAAMIGIGVICFAGGAFMMWFIPILWSWIKPFIHAITA